MGTIVRRRTIVLVLVGLVAFSIAALGGYPGAQAQSALSCRVDYVIINQWSGAFQAEVKINNTGSTAIQGWTATWSFANGQSITQLWNGSHTQSGAAVSVKDLGWNASIAPGGVQGFGFIANWSGTNGVPVSFAVNGTPCGGAPLPSATPTRAATPVSSPTPSRTSVPTAVPTRTPVPPATPTRTPTGGFFDDMNGFNTGLFHKADGWTNGNPFNVGWRADHVTFSNSTMTLTLDNRTCPSGCSNKPYASGEYRTNSNYGYGRYEGRFKAAKGSGTVAASLFTYTGPSDNQPWDEIDIEILGKDTTKMQTNYYTNGVGGHETMINLGFDASQGFHTYAFEWTPTSIKWYVDGVLVHTENGSRGPLPTHASKLMMNLWPGVGVDSWLGPFNYSGPLTAQFDWVRYTPLP
ncbi:MAG TPA: family 16 glycosylhydrolase [Roseiflexaceae bacterium]|nr:family 16 glycosylhydrolase [Roseiflexaceae bacterium]